MTMELKRELHKGDEVSLAAIALSIIAALVTYSYLPEKVASHWNIYGIADGFIEKEIFLAGFPILMVLTFVAMSLIPRAKELKYEMSLLHREYSGFKAAVITFLCYIYLVIIYSNTALSPLHVSTPQLLFPGISVFLYYLATVMPRLKRNHFVGIRTPWTIHSDRVWEKTHKLGSKLFKALSIAIMLATLTASGYSTWLVIIPLLVVGAILVAYSYKIREKTVEKRKMQKKKKVKSTKTSLL